MASAFIGLGSNVGDRLAYLQKAVRVIDREAGRVRALSRVYETAAWGSIRQGDFLNAVAQLETDLAPHDLLRKLLQIEHDLGRKRRERWGPRVIDLDVLLYDDQVIEDDDLRVPHPYLASRKFVLIPLFEVAPDLSLPDHRRLRDLIEDEAVKAQKVQVFNDGLLSLPGAR